MAQHCFTASSHIVDKLKETQVEGEMLLRNPSMRPQPRAEQRPKAFYGVDVDFTEAVTVLVTRIFPSTMANRSVAITPRYQRLVDHLFVGVDEAAGCNRRFDNRLNGFLLHIF